MLEDKFDKKIYVIENIINGFKDQRSRNKSKVSWDIRVINKVSLL